MGQHLDRQQGQGVQDLTSSGPLSLGFSGQKHVASARVFTEAPLPCPWPGHSSQALSLGLQQPPYPTRTSPRRKNRQDPQEGWNRFYWGGRCRPTRGRVSVLPSWRRPEAWSLHPQPAQVSGTCEAQSEGAGRGESHQGQELGGAGVGGTGQGCLGQHGQSSRRPQAQ